MTMIDLKTTLKTSLNSPTVASSVASITPISSSSSSISADQTFNNRLLIGINILLVVNIGFFIYLTYKSRITDHKIHDLQEDIENMNKDHVENIMYLDKQVNILRRNYDLMHEL